MTGLHLARAWIIAALLVATALFSHAPAQSGAAMVLINEFMPAPGSGREWAELINLGDLPADVGGWRIDDDLPGNSGQALIPAGTVIPPGGLFVIEWNANFLNNTGDTIQLIDSAGDTLDAHTYGSASIDLSLARQPDGAPLWVWGPPTRGNFNAPLPDPPTITPTGASDTPAPTATAPAPDDATGTPTAVAPTPSELPTATASATPTATPSPTPTVTPTAAPSPTSAPTASATPTATPSPTPSATPTATPSPTPTPTASATATPLIEPGAVLINEIAPAADPEWIELYNPGAEVVHLTGWQLERLSTGQPLSRALPHLTLAPGEYAVVTLTRSTLPNGGASLTLRSSTGVAVDGPILYPALEGEAVYARAGDGAATWSVDYPPSPGAPNLPPLPTPTRAPSPTAEPSPTRTPSPTAEPSPTRTPSPTAEPSPTRTPSPTRAPSPTAEPSPCLLYTSPSPRDS